MAKRKSFVILCLSKRLAFYVPPRNAIERAGSRLANVRSSIHIYYIIHLRSLQKLFGSFFYSQTNERDKSASR